MEQIEDPVCRTGAHRGYEVDEASLRLRIRTELQGQGKKNSDGGTGFRDLEYSYSSASFYHQMKLRRVMIE